MHEIVGHTIVTYNVCLVLPDERRFERNWQFRRSSWRGFDRAAHVVVMPFAKGDVAKHRKLMLYFSARMPANAATRDALPKV
jgi:hypothetical protein